MSTPYEEGQRAQTVWFGGEYEGHMMVLTAQGVPRATHSRSHIASFLRTFPNPIWSVVDLRNWQQYWPPNFRAAHSYIQVNTSNTSCTVMVKMHKKFFPSLHPVMFFKAFLHLVLLIIASPCLVFYLISQICDVFSICSGLYAAIFHLFYFLLCTLLFFLISIKCHLLFFLTSLHSEELFRCATLIYYS